MSARRPWWLWLLAGAIGGALHGLGLADAPALAAGVAVAAALGLAPSLARAARYLQPDAPTVRRGTTTKDKEPQ